ncbi:pentatricopeptide repeat (PPR) superfamily protein [Striga asiatica]|uniref:Pentatricopeptide repeat (PPR) superfamily protein n=1 Tax=Striga asiatica TaxID=4170 RepID=A0A5A7QLJ3_STRAF|nr:pentatricopeptide repeat (PPR) superfamily protein [Striga asiatica]
MPMFEDPDCSIIKSLIFGHRRLVSAARGSGSGLPLPKIGVLQPPELVGVRRGSRRSFQPLSEDGAKQTSIVESSKLLDDSRKLLETWPRRTLVPSLAVVAGLWRSGLLRTGRTGGLLLEIADGQLSLVMKKDGPPLLMRCHGELPVKAATGGLRGSKDSPAACYRREFPEEITESRLDVGG